MGNYASTSDVAALVPYRPISSTTNPSTTQVSGWVDQAEAQIDAILRGVGLSVPATDAKTVLEFREAVAWKVSGVLLQAYASAVGDPGNTTGESRIKDWNDWLERVRTNPSQYGAEFGQGTSATNLTAFSISSGLAKSNFAPSFKLTEKF